VPGDDREVETVKAEQEHYFIPIGRRPIFPTTPAELRAATGRPAPTPREPDAETARPRRKRRP
jgi:hypothetical protein